MMKIKSKKEIGGGEHGIIQKIKTIFQRKTKSNKIIKKNREFVIKKYKTKKECDTAFENYTKLKKIKIPTFTTFKKISETEILMTNLSTKKQYCISLNYDSEDSFQIEKNPIGSINNFEKYLTQSIELVQKLHQNNIVITLDGFFLLISKTKPQKIELFLGDLDFIYFETPEDIQFSLQNIKSITQGLIYNFVYPIYQKEYLTILSKYIK